MQDGTSTFDAAAREPVRVVYDTDMALDVDDVGGLAALHKLADRGECEILAVVVSESSQGHDGQWAPPLVDVVNTYYGRPSIPIGVYTGPHRDPGRTGQYAEQVVRAGFAHDLQTGSEAEDAVRVYRRTLAAQPDNSVTIITVGYLTNLNALLDSGPDEFSSESGRELIGRKVKMWSCMGGTYPSSGEGGEFNFTRYPAAAEHVVNTWPGRVVFGGFELGRQYKVGGTLNKRYDPSANPVALAWLKYNNGAMRESWDELAVLYGVRGAEHDGVEYFKLVEGGSNRVALRNDEALNSWASEPTRNQAYLVPSAPLAAVEAILEELITAAPEE